MSAAAGPDSAGARLGGSSTGNSNTGVTAGRAWLAALPGELAAQRRVMAGLIEFCEVTPLVTARSSTPTSTSAGARCGRPTTGSTRHGTTDLRRATRASAALLTKVSASAAHQCPADLPSAMAGYVTHALSRDR